MWGEWGAGARYEVCKSQDFHGMCAMGSSWGTKYRSDTVCIDEDLVCVSLTLRLVHWRKGIIMKSRKEVIAGSSLEMGTVLAVVIQPWIPSAPPVLWILLWWMSFVVWYSGSNKRLNFITDIDPWPGGQCRLGEETNMEVRKCKQFIETISETFSMRRDDQMGQEQGGMEGVVILCSSISTSMKVRWGLDLRGLRRLYSRSSGAWWKMPLEGSLGHVGEDMEWQNISWLMKTNVSSDLV